MVPQKSFLEFVSDIFEKWKKMTVLTPLEKNLKYPKKDFFFEKSYIFFLNLYFKFDKNVIYGHCPSMASMAQTMVHRVLFLVSMDIQRSNRFDGSHFWASGHLPTASEWLSSMWAIMAPTG